MTWAGQAMFACAQNHQDTAYWYGAAKHPYAVTKTVYPDSGEVTVSYNDDGTVATGADQRAWTVTYTYDDARRVTAESVSGTGLVGTTAVAYAYDALGRPTSVTDNNDPSDGNDNSTVQWAYTREADGDLKVEETQKYGTMTDRTVAYEYALSGRLKDMDYPSNLTLTYSYDDLGRVTAVNDGTNDRVSDTWKGWLLQKREYASGAYLTYLDDQGGQLSGYGYDTFGRPKNHRWRSSGGSLLSGWNHDYDRIGNKKYQEDLQAAAQSELYGYDAVYRLTSFKRGQLNQDKTDIVSPTRTQTWSLDPLGNWDSTVLDGSSESRAHNGINELTARTPSGQSQIDLTYDNAGNLIQDGDADGDHKYVWDYRNRLIEAQEKQGESWVTVGEYKYDARSRRVLKTVTNKGDLNGTTRFLWGGDSAWQCLEERDANGDLVARYTYSPGYIDALAVQERDLNADSDFGDTNEVVYYHANTLASVYALSDANESVVERYRYDAYGGVTVLDADGSADSDGISDVGNAYAFTGRRLELETGNQGPETALLQYRHRYYSPQLGRFISRDPVGYVGHPSLYCYVQGSVTAYRDPLGLGVDWEHPGIPSLGSMSVTSGADGLIIRANYMDECCDEINFRQYYRRKGKEEWYNDWGKGKDRSPNPPFYLRHGHATARSGRGGHVSQMTDDPGGVLWGPAYEFVTCAVCAAGESRGTVYGCVSWTVDPTSDWRRLLGADQYKDLQWRMMSPDEWDVRPSLTGMEALALGLALYGYAAQ